MWFTRLSKSARGALGPKGSPDHSKSVGATGGVYKGQGLNQYVIITHTYKTFRVKDQEFQGSIPNTAYS